MCEKLITQYFESVVDSLRDKGVWCAPGLTTAEFEAAETEYGFRFPPDLRALLEHVLPVGEEFPDWREPRSALIRDQLAWPSEGICFSVEHNEFWFSTWGKRPRSRRKARMKAMASVRQEVFLIPVYAHRYLPAWPSEPGNPVFSVHQTDIIHYGFDLPSYLWAEFEIPNPFPATEAPREIPFWGELVRLNR